MHHARLGGFGFDVVPSWVNCRNMYTYRSWRIEEWDEEGAHMLEDLLSSWWMNKAHHAGSERNTCMEPSYKSKTIKDPATPNHAEYNTKHTQDYAHHLVVKPLDKDTTASQYMLALSCQVVSWVVKATSPPWAIYVVTECNVKWKSNRRT